MTFIELKDGTAIRADMILAVRPANARKPDRYCPALNPRIIIDFGSPEHPNGVVIDCSTDEERDAMVKSIMAEIKGALKKMTDS